MRSALGLGANIGDPIQAIRSALKEINKRAGKVVSVSSAYRTEPWGNLEQPDFVNAVVLIETGLTAIKLHAVLKDIETGLGRTRTKRWGPRVIDIDILLYNGDRIDLPELQVPHPWMTERLFVMAPLAEIAPDWIIPGFGTASEIAENLAGTTRCEIIEDVVLWPQ